MRVVVVIQARTASSRLPGKVLLPICGQPLLARMLERVRLAREPDQVVVATTTDGRDDDIAALCNALKVTHFRGHPLDCLDRHLRAGRAHRADAIVKIPSDCPLIDPAAIDRVVSAFRAGGHHDYVSNLNPPTWPDGNDVEVIARTSLELAAAEAQDPFDREHTTPFITSRPQRFRLGNVSFRADVDLSQRFRWVVDWAEDLVVVRHIFEALLPSRGAGFGVEEILDLYRRRPALEAINAARRGYHYSSARRSAAAASAVQTAHRGGTTRD